MIRPEQLAVHLDISISQVRRLTLAGMPSVRTGARSVRYDAAACVAWLQAHEETVTQCLSKPRPAAGGTSLSASAASAYTAACRRAQLRVMPSESNQS